jgi:hypothetical protein
VGGLRTGSVPESVAVTVSVSGATGREPSDDGVGRSGIAFFSVKVDDGPGGAAQGDDA